MEYSSDCDDLADQLELYFKEPAAIARMAGNIWRLIVGATIITYMGAPPDLWEAIQNVKEYRGQELTVAGWF